MAPPAHDRPTTDPSAASHLQGASATGDIRSEDASINQRMQKELTERLARFREESETPEEVERRLEAERDRTFAFMSERFPNAPKCPFCEHNTYTVSEIIHLDSGIIFGTSQQKVWPMFMVICTTCGHTFLFNALTSGVMDPPGEEPENGDAE